MPHTTKTMNRRGRRPSLSVAARKASKLQTDVKQLLAELVDLEQRLLRLDSLMEASRRAEQHEHQERARVARRGIRGKGPNVRDVAYDLLARRKKPMTIQDIARHVLKSKKGTAGTNFTQNLGSALSRDPRFVRVGRGTYSITR